MSAHRPDIREAEADGGEDRYYLLLACTASADETKALVPHAMWKWASRHGSREQIGDGVSLLPLVAEEDDGTGVRELLTTCFGEHAATATLPTYTAEFETPLRFEGHVVLGFRRVTVGVAVAINARPAITLQEAMSEYNNVEGLEHALLNDIRQLTHSPHLYELFERATAVVNSTEEVPRNKAMAKALFVVLMDPVYCGPERGRGNGALDRPPHEGGTYRRESWAKAPEQDMAVHLWPDWEDDFTLAEYHVSFLSMNFGMNATSATRRILREENQLRTLFHATMIKHMKNQAFAARMSLRTNNDHLERVFEMVCRDAAEDIETAAYADDNDAKAFARVEDHIRNALLAVRAAYLGCSMETAARDEAECLVTIAHSVVVESTSGYLFHMNTVWNHLLQLHGTRRVAQLCTQGNLDQLLPTIVGRLIGRARETALKYWNDLFGQFRDPVAYAGLPKLVREAVDGMCTGTSAVRLSQPDFSAMEALLAPGESVASMVSDSDSGRSGVRMFTNPLDLHVVSRAGMLVVHWTPWIERCGGQGGPLFPSRDTTTPVFRNSGRAIMDGGGGRGDSE